jgi:MSHA biogenesis protein MshO
MRPIRRSARRVRGMTLIEMIIAMAIAAIVVGMSLFLVTPLQQSVDTTSRAELTDIADNALQRLSRDVRLALPNSVRANGTAVEFIPLRTGGRYRSEPAGACTGVSDDHLAFDAVDGCFKSIGPIANAATVAAGDFLVLNNYGKGFSGQSQDAYSGGNRIAILAVAGQQVTYDTSSGFQFVRNLHDSPGRRFFIVTKPVSYVCDLVAGTVTRYDGYTFTATQQTTFTGGTSALLASNVAACSFVYLDNVAPMVGLLTLQLSLRKAVATGNETITLYQAVHVNNVP